jgi:predicted nucleic acid-binding protein
VSIYEVFKRVLQQRGEGAALQAVALMQQGDVVDLSEPLALDAGRVSVELQIPMADAIILTTARVSGATLWTQDSHFEGIAGIEYVSAGSPNKPIELTQRA